MGLIPANESRVVQVDPGAQDGWITTRLDFLVNWARAGSLWPMPFGTACCAIEFMATAASRYDLARFGMERQRVTQARPPLPHRQTASQPASQTDRPTEMQTASVE